MAASLQRVPLIEAFLLGDDANVSYMTVDIPETFLQQARNTVSQRVAQLFKAPLKISQELGSRASTLMGLVSGKIGA